LASWALSPQAVEAIRAQMLRGAARCDALFALRDATIVSLQYGLATRNQEMWGLRWSSVDGDFAWVAEVISYGRLEHWGKTAMSTRRRTAIPGILREDLQRWRQALVDAGHNATMNHRSDEFARLAREVAAPPRSRWPLNTPPEAEVTRVADMYLQESRYIDLGLPVQSVRVEMDSRPGGSPRCRLVEETTVTQQILRVYCVKTFALLRKKLSKKTVGFGVLAVGVAAAVVFPVLLAAHVVAATTAAIVAGGSAGASAIGGGILTLSPGKAPRNLATQEERVIELVDTDARSHVRSTAGP
jgi:hypothetical protein